jgi:hypothetical protein
VITAAGDERQCSMAGVRLIALCEYRRNIVNDAGIDDHLFAARVSVG